MSSLGAKFKQLPFVAQAVITLVGVAAVAGVGVFVYKKLASIGQNKESREEAQAAGSELDQLLNTGIRPTFTDAEAQAKTNLLITAANGCDPWEQGATQIMAVVYSCKNAADWYLLNSKFGVRSWEGCPYGTESGSLTTLLTSELGSSQMSEVRRHLGQFGINF